MTLAEYVKQCSGPSKTAARMGIGRATLWRWLNGDPPDSRLVEKIEKNTGGKISRYDLRPDLWPPPKKNGRKSA